MKGLGLGRIVHYVMPNGEHRAAIVTKVSDKEAGIVCLHVFVMFAEAVQGWQSTSPNAGNAISVDYSETPETDTWHWPEYVE